MIRWLPLVLLLVLARPAAASLEASWGSACTPIVTDRLLPAGATQSRLFFSVTGLSGTVQAFQFRFSYGSRFSPDYPNCGAFVVPDAWRFDLDGCGGPSLVQIKLTARDVACPHIFPPGGAEVTKITYDPLVSQATIIIAQSFLTAVTADPSIRYHLADLLFDHTLAVNGPGSPPNTCGGFEAPICFTLQGGEYDAHGDCEPSDGGVYLDANGVEHSFGPYPNVIATFRTDAASVACDGATPARPTTWGALRAQYR